MKLHLLLLPLVLLADVATPATITVTNNNGPALTRSIVDNAGNAIEGGYAAIGTIDETALAVLSGGGDLTTAFTLFDGAEGPLNGVPFAGTFSVQSQGSVLLNEANEFSGNPIYLVLGNGADLASSSLIGILQVGAFGNSEPSIVTITIDENNSEPPYRFWGSWDRLTLNPGPVPNRDNPAFALGVPEPSINVLVGFALVGLGLRRRS